MNLPAPTPPPRRRGAVVALAGTVLVLLLAAAALAVLLPMHSLRWIASGLEGSAARVEAAFAPEVPESLRAAMRDELAAQAAWLREQAPLALSAATARQAAGAAERVPLMLADEHLDAEECRRFVDWSRGLRTTGPAARQPTGGPPSPGGSR